jgi:protein TonB
MPTETLPTRAEAPTSENLSRGFWLAIALHGIAIGGLIAAAWIGHIRHPSWGEHSLQAGSISATMVPTIPLPARVPTNKDNVLASEHESVAPKPPTPKAAPPPKPNEVLIPTKAAQPKPNEKPTPEPPKHPLPTPPDPKKAAVGDTSGTLIPQAIQHLHNGTASITIDDRSFGERYAYYAKIVDQKVSQSWDEAQIFPGASSGSRAVVVFTINADGTPTDVHILTKSGSPAFDNLAVRTVQRIDGFGPLPQSKPIQVEFAFDYKQP